MRYLAADVGGTFTDIVLVDSDAGCRYIDKVPSGARGAAAPIADAIHQILGPAGLGTDDIDLFVHGFTVSTNALLMSAGARAALVTTKGFRDVLEIRNQLRPKLYSVTSARPEAVITRDRVFEVDERIDSFGQVVRPLSQQEIARVADEIAAVRPESVAVCLTFAHLNDMHEAALAQALSERLPRVPVYVSHKVNPQIEEWQRSNTVSIAAYVGPIVDRYLKELEQTLAEHAVKAPLLIMRSDGGVATPQSSRINPAHTLLSGPAGGVVAGRALSAELGIGNVITFDMGGTSADFSAIVEGETRIIGERMISGHPLRLPTLDVETISAGGGSVGWIDLGGALRVGPQSSGSVPGPACYPNGGADPTITDAALIVGLLDPDSYLGGRIKLDAEAARRAILEKVANPLGVSVEEAAHGMIRIATAGMAQAIRSLCVERGVDPRTFWILGFGGAGPLFSGFLVHELEMRGSIIPAHPGVFAAEGLLMSDIRHSSQSPATGLVTDDGQVRRFRERAEELRLETDRMLGLDGIADSRRSFRCFAGLRYVGQFHELRIEVGSVKEQWNAGNVLQRFHEQHQTIYGHSAPDVAVEFVTVYVDALGRIDRPAGATGKAAAVASAGGTGVRKVLFDPAKGFIDARVLDRRSLTEGDEVAGPAILNQLDSTVIVGVGEVARIAKHQTILIERKPVA